MRFVLESEGLSPALRMTGEPATGTRGVEDRRIAVDHEYFRARSRILSIGGCVIVHGSNRALVDLELKSEQLPPPVVFALTIDGSASPNGDSRGLPHTQPRSHGVFYLPEPGYRFRLEGGRRRSVFEVNLSREYLGALFERFPSLEDSFLVAAYHGRPLSMHSAPGALSSSMLDLAREIMESELHGPARAMFVEAKVLELIARQLAELVPRGAVAPRRPQLSRTQIERMHEARARLLERLDTPPSLAELSRLVGTNEFALKRDFKTVFGKTVYSLLYDRRMEIARRLLLDTDSTIDEIAERVGYSSAAHFSNAFRRGFGYPPSQLRGTARGQLASFERRKSRP